MGIEGDKVAALRAQAEQNERAATAEKMAKMAQGMEAIAAALAAYRESLLAQGFTRAESITMAAAMQGELMKLAMAGKG